jgi:hypothetical protein
MDLSCLSDESLLKYYEAIRVEVSADIRSASGHSFLGELAKQRANDLLTEIYRRELKVTPIYWPH